jgi:hypothetical protein
VLNLGNKSTLFCVKCGIKLANFTKEELMLNTLSVDSVIVAAPEQVSCDLAGEAAILNLKSGVYFGLNPIGARIWELIQEPKAAKDIVHVLLEEYDVDPQRCESDVLQLLHDLSQHELIQVKGS